MDQSFYRQDALAAQRVRGLHGEVLEDRPRAYSLLAVVALAVVLLVIGYAFWGEYTRKERASGYLLPVEGIAPVYPPMRGVVTAQHVREGESVAAGQRLFSITSERSTREFRSAEAASLAHLDRRRELLGQEQARHHSIGRIDRAALRARLQGLSDELQAAERGLDMQRQRVHLATATVERHRRLVKDRYVSELQLVAEEEKLLDQQARLQDLTRNHLALQREARDARERLAAAGHEAAQRASSVARSLEELEQQITEQRARHRVTVVAPAAGRVTTLQAQVGQTVEIDRPLLTVLPPGGRLHAHLLLPTRAVGFVQAGQRVWLRYHAYPYQRFGSHSGRVTEIDRVPLAPGSAQALLPVTEPVYRVAVQLDRQLISAYGRQRELQAGLLLDADIEVDRRDFVGWLLDPLYSITGRRETGDIR